MKLKNWSLLKITKSKQPHFETVISKENLKLLLLMGSALFLLELGMSIFYTNPWGKEIHRMRIAIVVFLGIMLPIILYVHIKFDTYSKYSMFLINFTMLTILIWAAQISLAYQAYSNHIMIYIVTLLVFGSLIYTPIKAKSLIFVISVGLFLMQLNQYVSEEQLIITYVINSIFTCFLSLLISSVNLMLRFNNYSYTVTIEENNKTLSKLTLIDSMTGLYNHTCIFDYLIAEIHKCTRYGNALSIVMIDIDHFKNVNDQFGHPFGDQVILKFAEIISDQSRDIDLIGRYGGEEFLMILPNTTLDQAGIQVERIRKSIEAYKFAHNMQITFSGGIVQWSIESATELVDIADNLLYQAKRDGRNCLKLYDPR